MVLACTAAEQRPHDASVGRPRRREGKLCASEAPAGHWSNSHDRPSSRVAVSIAGEEPC
jgi:hypothetical protein